MVSPASENPFTQWTRQRAAIEKEFPHARYFQDGVDCNVSNSPRMERDNDDLILEWLSKHAGAEDVAWTSIVSEDPFRTFWIIRIKNADVYDRFVQEFGAGKM